MFSTGKKIFYGSLLLAGALLLAAGCSNPTGTDPFVPVTGIAGAPAEGAAGSEVDLNAAAVTPDNATNRIIVWTVKDPGTTGVAGIVDGKFTPASAGTVTVTATVVNGAAADTDYVRDFAIVIAADFVAVTNIAGAPVSGTAGTEVNLGAAAAEPANATNRIIVWTVKDAGTTGVTGIVNGRFTPANAGTATLTATIANGTAPGTDYVQDFALSIAAAFVPVANIAGAPTGAVAGTEVDLGAATVEPANADNKTIVWTVKDPGTTGVTGIVDGKFTPASPGTVTVTATVANGTAPGTDYVRDFAIVIAADFVAVTNIAGAPVSGIAGSEVDLSSAAAEPANATNRTITWTVKDPGTTGVTTADIVNGKFTPAGAGTLTLTAAVVNGTAQGAYTRDFVIVIAVVPVTNIAGVPSDGAANNEVDLGAAAAEPANATNRTIVWTVKSAGTTGVTGIVNGKFTPASAGTVTLTATIVGGLALGTPYTQDFDIVIATDFVPVTDISGVPAAGTAGTQVNLGSAAVAPPNATNKTIVWTVKDAGTTGVTNAGIVNGRFTPAGAGTLKLTAAIANGTAPGTAYTKDFDLVIALVPVTDITGAPAAGAARNEVDLGSATVEPANATNKTLVWTVKDAGTTGVTGIVNGKFTPASAGTLKLTATIANGTAPGTAYTKDFDITISFVAVTDITGAPESGREGSPVNLAAARVTPANASYKDISWVVKDAGTTGVATVAGGSFTPTAVGTLVLTARVASGLAEGTPYAKDITIEIESSFVAVTGITPAALNTAAGTALDLNSLVTVAPVDASYKDIVWSVKSAGATGLTTAGVATGSFTPAAAGTATLTGTIAKGKSEDNNEAFTQDITLTVIMPVTAITGVPSYGTSGYPVSLASAAAEPADATYTAIVWSVKDAGTTGVTAIANNSFTPASTGTIKVTATVANGSGAGTDFVRDFDIVITPPGERPVEVGLGEDTSIALRDKATILSKDAPIQVSLNVDYYVSISGSGYSDIVWYLNGTKQTVTGSLIYLDTSAAGTVKLSVEGKKDGVLESSGTYTFVISN
jgi:hypothetical protein